MPATGFDAYWIVAAVAAYYLCAWLMVGRKRSSGSITVRYKQPEDLSPAAMRFVYTMACDGRSYAAIIAQLAARRLLDIVPAGNSGQVMLQKCVEDDCVLRSLPEEEARVFKDLFEWGDRVELKRPDLSTIQHLQKTLEENRATAYFTRNFTWIVLGLALTGACTAWLGLSSGMFGHDAVDAWTAGLFTGLTVAVYGLAGYWAWDTNRLAFTLAIRGLYRRRTLPALLAFILLYPSLWFVLILTVAPRFAIVTTALILLNAFAAPCLRNYTSAGRIVRDEIEGFRDFLAGTEQDRLRRLNQPRQRVQVGREMIPYAIALDLSEVWGDELGMKAMVEIDL